MSRADIGPSVHACVNEQSTRFWLRERTRSDEATTVAISRYRHQNAKDEINQDNVDSSRR